jgi:hypothetical protein
LISLGGCPVERMPVLGSSCYPNVMIDVPLVQYRLESDEKLPRCAQVLPGAFMLPNVGLPRRRWLI